MTKLTQKSTQRDKTIQTRVTEEEYQIIEEKANFLGLTTSNYLRLVCLHAKIDITIQPMQPNED